MENLQVDSSKKSEVISGRDSTITKGLSDLTVGELILIIKKNSDFYRHEIREKSIHIRTMQQSLIEKNEIINHLTHQLEVVQTQNEEARQAIISEFSLLKTEIHTTYNYIVEHDKRCNIRQQILLKQN